MSRRSSGLLLSKAVAGFLQFKAAEAVSKSTMTSYTQHLRDWVNHCGDMELSKLTTEDLCAYMAYLRTEYKPRRLCGNNVSPLAPKTLRNIWVTFMAFFTWLTREFELENPMKGVPVPRFKKAPVDVFTKEQVELILKACDQCREADTSDRRKYTSQRASSKRDRAIILTLLDTGLRASELCSLKVGDVDMKSGRVEVKHGITGGAKGGKGRSVYLGKSTRRVVWRYLVDRDDGDQADAPLFLGKFGRPLNKDALRLLLGRLGSKAQVTKCHPHRFRHTFAITYLRSGGDVFTLQALLGHGSLDMVQHYARIAEVDIEQAHKRASPADNWRL